jgi:hypothetical protein
MGNFCTVQDVEDFLQIEITDADKVASCNRAIEEATEVIRNYCHQYIELVEDDAITLDHAGTDNRLFLPELPVRSVSRVIEDGEVLTAGSDEDYQWGQYGILYRVSRNWAAGIQIVQVIYTHGYDLYDGLPDDIIGVATRAAARAYQAGLRASETGGVPGVSAMSLGDYSVSYVGETGGGAGEGVMGASAARLLLLSEKDILNRYRYVKQ